MLSFIPLVMTVVMTGVWITLLVCIWRAMKAHESIAESIRHIAERS